MCHGLVDPGNPQENWLQLSLVNAIVKIENEGAMVARGPPVTTNRPANLDPIWTYIEAHSKCDFPAGYIYIYI